MQRKKKILALGLTLATASVAVVLGVASLDTSLVDALYKETEAPNQIVLNSSNKITSAGDKTQKTAKGNDIIFTYSGVASSTSGHVTLNTNGSIVNKTQITSLSDVTATFSGAGVLKARIAYTPTNFNEYFEISSGNKINLGSNPYYIEFKAFNSAVTISSIDLKFTCTANSEAEPQHVEGTYDITFATNAEDGKDDISSDLDAIMEQVASGADYINSFNADASKIYPGTNGLKFGKSNAPGSLTINFDSNKVKQNITKIDVTSAQYGSDTGKLRFFINGSSSYTAITPSEGGSVTVNAALTSLKITTSSKRAYLGSLTLCYDSTVEPGQPDNPTAYEIGFTASDANKDKYTTNSVFDTAKNLSVYVLYSDNTQTATNDYTYRVLNSLGQEIDTSKKFPAEGEYTLEVSYGNYIPQEITLNVGEYVYMTDVSASMTTTSFNTADILANKLADNLTAVIEYSNDTVSEEIPFSKFAENEIAIKLLNPKGITYNIYNPFGSVGTWTLKVYDVSDEEMYFNISLTVAAIPVASITLDHTSEELTVDDQLQLVPTVNPGNATNSDVVWASLDDSVATVSETGLVTAVGVGGTTITATAADGSNVYGSCTITVVAKPIEPTYTLVTSNSTLKNGDTVVVKTSAEEGVTGWSGYKDATISTTSSEWVEYTVSNASSSGWKLHDGSANKYIASPTANEFKYDTTGGTCSVDSDGHLVCNSRYLTINGTYIRFYGSIGSYTPFFVYQSTGGSGGSTPIYPTSISLSAESSSISIGATTQVNVGYTPSDTNVKNITYTSSSESIATVSNTGLVTGVAQGSATITATAQTASGTTSASTTITITPIAVTGVSLSSNSETVKVGKTVTLVPTVSPTNATNKNVNWSSSDTSIATVNDGVVTGVAAGTATITVRTVDGNKTATCTVVVQPASGGGEETFSITYTDLPAAYATTDTVYTADSGIKFQAYNCAGGYSSKMQFKASSGYLQSTEDLELQSVTINDRESNSLTVYGSNTAGSFSTEITGTNDVFDLTGYSYFKIARTGSGAAYCSSITVVTGTPTPTDPTGIILSPTSADLAPNGTKQLSVSYVPSNANQNKQITWTSSNTSVATVSNDGLVTVKSTASAGQKATITATLTNITSIKATCTITVVEQQKDDHTVLIYMCGADLESENQLATGDIQEILKVSGQPDDVNIVIETGGAKSWASTYGISSTYLERYHVKNKSLVRDDQLTYASMGLSSTLQSFIEYGLNNFPAERTGLVFWNHGGGMRGVCYDEKKNDDVLKNSEIRSAVSGALSNCGMSGQKLEWVGYDACLMAVQDIAVTNAEYFNYMIASEESEAGYGWDYDTWVDDLYSKKTTTNILKAIVDGFIADNGGASSGSGDQTLSYLNLSYAAAYKTAWENLAAQLNSKVTTSNKSSFNSAIISNVKHYADSDYDYFCTFDAWDFVDKLANNNAFSNFRVDASYITAVKNAHANLVAYNLAQKGAGVSKGLCMYWPNSTQYSDVSTYYTTSETTLTTWRSFCVNKGTHA